MFLSDIMIPLLIFLIIGYGLLCRHNIYEEFIEGAKDGFETVIGIMPTLIGLMVAVGILRASGFLECFSNVCAIFTEKIGFPSELLPLAVVKMFSSSAATGLLLDIYKECGTDSLLGRMASIMLGSTETIFLHDVCLFYDGARFQIQIYAGRRAAFYRRRCRYERAAAYLM